MQILQCEGIDSCTAAPLRFQDSPNFERGKPVVGRRKTYMRQRSRYKGCIKLGLSLNDTKCFAQGRVKTPHQDGAANQTSSRKVCLNNDVAGGFEGHRQFLPDKLLQVCDEEHDVRPHCGRVFLQGQDSLSKPTNRRQPNAREINRVQTGPRHVDLLARGLGP